MAKQSFKFFTPRDKPKKRGARQHKKNKNKSEKRQKKQLVTKAKVRVDNILIYPILKLTFFRLLFLGLPSLTKVWLG